MIATTRTAAVARRVLAPALLALTLFAGASTAVTPASARVKGPVGDSFSAGCLVLQNQYDDLLSEYKNATPARSLEIINEMRNANTTWNQIGCGAVFGNIAYRVAPEVTSHFDAVGSAGAVAVLNNGSVPTGGHFSPDGIVAKPVARR